MTRGRDRGEMVKLSHVMGMASQREKKQEMPTNNVKNLWKNIPLVLCNVKYVYIAVGMKHNKNNPQQFLLYSINLNNTLFSYQ